MRWLEDLPSGTLTQGPSASSIPPILLRPSPLKRQMDITLCVSLTALGLASHPSLFFLKVTPQNFCTLSSLESLLDGARPRSLPAGGYEPPRRPRYTVKRSIFTPTSTTQTWYRCHPYLVSLCSDHFCACRKKYPIQIYVYEFKISPPESSKREWGWSPFCLMLT